MGREGADAGEVEGCTVRGEAAEQIAKVKVLVEGV